MNKSIICPYCKIEVIEGFYQRHISKCESIFNKRGVLECDYLSIGSVEKVAKKHNISATRLSRLYKEWGVSIKSKNGKFSRLYELNDDFFDTMSSLQYWFIGLMASDGCIERDRYIQIAQSGDDGMKLIEYLNKILDRNGSIRISKTGKKDAYSFSFTSDKILEVLNKHNIVSNKTYSYTMPNIPLKYLQDFLRGYVEGDGCITICTNKNGFEYLHVSFVGTKEFILQVYNLLPDNKKGKYRKVNHSSVYNIWWNGKNAIDFCEWLFSTPNLYKSYKYYNFLNGVEIFKNTRDYKYIKIKESVLARMQEEDFNISDLSKEYIVPFQTLYKWVKEFKNQGYILKDIKNKVKYYPNELKIDICNEIQSGVKVSDCAKKYNINPRVIYEWVSKFKKGNL